MILAEEELNKYLGNTLDALRNKVSENTLEKLGEYERYTNDQFNLSVIDYLFLAHQKSKKGLASLSRDIGISAPTMRRVFRAYDFPVLTKEEVMTTIRQTDQFRQKLKEKWQDPERREKRVRSMREAANMPERREKMAHCMRERWQDLEYREDQSRMQTDLWKNSEVRGRRVQGLRDKLQYPEQRERMSQASRRNWQDPEYREKVIQGLRNNAQDPKQREKRGEILRKRWQDPEYRERMSQATHENWQDPEIRDRRVRGLCESDRNYQDPAYREKMAEASRRNWQDPGYRERLAQSMREAWKDPGLRKRRSNASRRNWQDPEYRERMILAIHRNWQDPEYREACLERFRISRLNPENLNIPTIHGQRNDIGFYAKSTWEANLARILLYCGREFITDEKFDLEVPDEFREFFSDKTEQSIDFVVRDPRGNIVLYEIIAHPYEDPLGYIKFEILQQQYPELDIRAVSKDVYGRLKSHFEQKINSTPFLRGWETSKDNLRTNPHKYS